IAECGAVADPAADDRQVLDVKGAEDHGGEGSQTDDAGQCGVPPVYRRLHQLPPFAHRADCALNVAGFTAPAFGTLTRPSKLHMKKLNHEPSDAVPVSAWYCCGSFASVVSMTPLLALSMSASEPRPVMSWARSGRTCCSNDAVALARPPMLSMAVPMALRS